MYRKVLECPIFNTFKFLPLQTQKTKLREYNLKIDQILIPDLRRIIQV